MIEIFAYPLLVLLFTMLFTLEVIAPASKNQCNRRWLILSGAFGVLQMTVSLGVGVYFKEWFLSHALWNLNNELPAIIIGFISFLMTSFFFYGWHRALHQNAFLWRKIHQLHHSPQRVESLTAFFAHPIDSAFATLLSCLSAYLILGASAEAAAWALLFTGLFNFYIHSDTTSPFWVGYILQRPEMHRIHHKRGYHANNYGLPIWDILFGTYENTNEYVPEVGFSEENTGRVYDMLKGIDVHEP